MVNEKLIEVLSTLCSNSEVPFPFSEEEQMHLRDHQLREAIKTVKKQARLKEKPVSKKKSSNQRTKRSAGKKRPGKTSSTQGMHPTTVPINRKEVRPGSRERTPNNTTKRKRRGPSTSGGSVR
jgi:hypothetical protein